MPRLNVVTLLIMALSAICQPSSALANADNMLPMPRQIDMGKRSIRLKRCSLAPTPLKAQWVEWLSESGVTVKPDDKFAITFDSVSSLPGNSPEAYSISVARDGIVVGARSQQGQYLALQTLKQLADADRRGLKIQECRIVDYPEFPYRGIMVDVGRTYMSLPLLKELIASLSQFKINVFHWHLTENQSWRLESRLYPQLNDSVNTTRNPGKYYTFDEARQLVEHAKRHNVILIPEIDVPGHSEAFRRTFGCDMQSAEGMPIIEALIDEACDIFRDVPYIHLGTDEVAFTNPDFVPKMVARARSKGKKVISWNPGWRYAPGEIDMTQLWSYRGKAQPGIPAVDSRFHYLNHFDNFADIVALYRSSIYGRPRNDASGQVAGAEIALWNDRNIESDSSIIRQNATYQAALALAERAWTGGGTEYFDSLGTNLTPLRADDFNSFADFERRMLWHKENTLPSDLICYVKQSDVNWLITDAFPNGGDCSMSFPPETEGTAKSYVHNGTTYGTAPATGATIYLRHVWGTLIPTFYADPQPNHTAYAFTYIYSPKAQQTGALIEFQNYSRSEPDLPPPAGQWDGKGSKVWLNDEEILPPTWEGTHNIKDNEIFLTNENCAARPPMAINLKKGWNKVMLKLPVASFSTPETRLVKWMFTFVVTTPDGKSTPDGLIYSPDMSK